MYEIFDDRCIKTCCFIVYEALLILFLYTAHHQHKIWTQDFTYCVIRYRAINCSLIVCGCIFWLCSWIFFFSPTSSLSLPDSKKKKLYEGKSGFLSDVSLDVTIVTTVCKLIPVKACEIWFSFSEYGLCKVWHGMISNNLSGKGLPSFDLPEHA